MRERIFITVYGIMRFSARGGGGVIFTSAVVEQEENSEDTALAVLSFIKSILHFFEKKGKDFGGSATIPVWLVSIYLEG